MSGLLTIGLIALTGYGGLVTWVWIRQDSFVYYPDRQVALTPAYLGMDFTPFRIPVGKQDAVTGWYVPVESARGTVLCCHGNAGNIGDRLDKIRAWHEARMNVLIFDYRGYGDSPGTPSERATYEDAQVVWEHATGNMGVDPRRLIVHGRSLGASVAAELACRIDPAGLILESGFSSAPDVAADMFPFLPARLVCRYRYATVEKVGRVQCPVIVAHAVDDEMIPFKHAEMIFGASRSPHVLIRLSGGHNGPGLCGTPDALHQAILFLDPFLQGREGMLLP